MNTFQKPLFTKRLAAWLIDIVLLLTLALGLNFLMSLITDYDSYSAGLEDIYDSYEEMYNTDFDILTGSEEYEALDTSEKARYELAVKALSEDENANALYNKVMSLIIMNVSISVLVSTLIIEFVLPLIFKNGMTPGKKIFGLTVIRTDFVKAHTFELLVRALLGKYTLEIMLPILIILLTMFGSIGTIGPLVLLLYFILNVVLFFVTPRRRPLHDLISDCCVADYQTQTVFSSAEDKNVIILEADKNSTDIK